MTTQTNEHHICGACSHDAAPSPFWIAIDEAIDRLQVAMIEEETTR